MRSHVQAVVIGCRGSGNGRSLHVPRAPYRAALPSSPREGDGWT